MLLNPNDRISTDDVEVAVDIYQGEDTYIVYDEDGEQSCFVSDEDSWGV